MKSARCSRPGIWCGVAGFLCILLLALPALPSAAQTRQAKSEPTKEGEPTAKIDEQCRVPVAVARDRAQVMHDIYAATLHMMHERYFHGDRAAVPARALQDVFAEIKRQSHTEARWISVNLKPMSIDHEPKTEFEKRAAKEMAAGKAEVEAVEDGYYRRAEAIPLSGGCMSCHAGFFADSSTSAKFAGLVISMPIAGESSAAK